MTASFLVAFSWTVFLVSLSPLISPPLLSSLYQLHFNIIYGLFSSPHILKAHGCSLVSCPWTTVSSFRCSFSHALPMALCLDQIPCFSILNINQPVSYPYVETPYFVDTLLSYVQIALGSFPLLRTNWSSVLQGIFSVTKKREQEWKSDQNIFLNCKHSWYSRISYFTVCVCVFPWVSTYVSICMWTTGRTQMWFLGYCTSFYLRQELELNLLTKEKLAG